jgi:hypothetical protein
MGSNEHDDHPGRGRQGEQAMRPNQTVRRSPGDSDTTASVGGVAEAAAPGSRSVELSHGRTLVVRPVAPRDIDGLAALYGHMDVESRYRRFFSVYTPDHSFFERLANPAGRDGVELVAVVRTDGRDEIVGEAGYFLMPNRDGELAMAVDRSWRGWLGAYLLDAVVEVAASNGVPNLEADILQINRPMLALVRSRGYATVPSDDFTVVRVMIGAAERMPTWPGPHDRPRVLVEGAGGRWHDQGSTDAAGLHVLTCPGPSAQARRCPVLSGRPCPLAAGADIIVVSRPSDTDAWQTIRSAHTRVHPGVPVCVELARRGGSAAAASEQVLKSTDDVLSVVERVARHRMAGG